MSALMNSLNSMLNYVPGAAFVKNACTNETLRKVITTTGIAVGGCLALHEALDLTFGPGSAHNPWNALNTSNHSPLVDTESTSLLTTIGKVSILTTTALVALSGLGGSASSTRDAICSMIDAAETSIRIQAKVAYQVVKLAYHVLSPAVYPLEVIGYHTIKTSYQLGKIVCQKGMEFVKIGLNCAKKVSDFIISPNRPEQSNNNWIQTLQGMAHSPFATMAGLTTVAVGTLVGFISPAITKAAMTNKMPKILLFPLIHFNVTSIGNEEFLTRALFQELILKKGLSSVLQICSSRLADFNRDHLYAKVARTTLSSLFFAYLHVLSASSLSEENKFQLLNTFGMGMVLGYLQEKTGRVFASLGAHIGHNLFVTLRGINWSPEIGEF